MPPVRLFFALGSLSAGLAVALGAFGAHILRGTLDAAELETFEVGVRYQMYHSLALLAVAWAASRWETPAVAFAGWFFAAGILIFSGSLYVLVLTGPRWLGAVTPIGGASLLIGWILLAWSALRA